MRVKHVQKEDETSEMDGSDDKTSQETRSREAI
jgi:hypothetical protein